MISRFAAIYILRVGKHLKEENPKTISEKAEWSDNTTEVEMEKRNWEGVEMEHLGGEHSKLFLNQQDSPYRNILFYTLLACICPELSS